MKIMLLYPKWTDDYGMFAQFAKKASTWPPLNLAYLAAVAESRGHQVKIIDGQAEELPLEKIIDATEAFGPNVIGITATTPFYHFADRLAEGLKQRMSKVPIAIGGTHITILKEKALSPFFDYGFVGEAERSWPMFLERYENGKDVSDVKGIIYRAGDSIKFTGDAEYIDDLDSIPPPARHLLKMDLYKMGTMQGTKDFTTIMTTRGCPFKCIFCSTKVFGSRIRKRSLKLVMDEMKSIISKYNIKHFIILDDTLTLDKKHILEFCNMIEKEKLGITFEGSTRANLVDEEIVSRMAKAGLIRISFGLESVDPEIRKTIRKEVPLESYAVANKLTNKYGIETLNSCMIGLPGDTVKTIKKTMTYLRNSPEIKQANLSIAVPYPGTELYDMAKKGERGLKLMTEDFSKYRRYNAAVMTVGNLSPDDLIKLQNDAFVSIYLAPWRMIPMLRKSGLMGGVLMLLRLMRSMRRLVFDRKSPSLFIRRS